MKMPNYVNSEALLSDAEVDRAVNSLPSILARSRLTAHVAVTNAIINEMALVADKERDHIASWLDEQGGVYTTVAKAIREGATPTLDQPPQIESRPMELEVELREALTEAVQQRDALQIEVEALRAGAQTVIHPKPWAVRGNGGQMHYYDTRAAARREANGGIVVDCR